MRLSKKELKTLIENLVKEMFSKGSTIFERSYPEIHIVATDKGRKVIDPQYGETLASEDEVKRWGQDRNRWHSFLKDKGVDSVRIKGRYEDRNITKKKFLDTLTGQKSGTKTGVIKGRPDTPPGARRQNKGGTTMTPNDVMRKERRDA